MSRDGSGVYSLPAGSTITNGDVSDSSDLNTPLADIAADLNVARPIVAGGTGATTAAAAVTNLGFTRAAADISTMAWSFIASTDASDDASINFTGFDATEYDAYMFVIALLEPATDGADLWIRTSTNGGSSYDSGSTDYAYAQNIYTSSANTAAGSSGASAIRLVNNVGAASGEQGVSGHVLVTGAGTALRNIITGHVGGINASGGISGSTFTGQRLAAADVDAIRFLFSSGNIERGTITMYGLRNA